MSVWVFKKDRFSLEGGGDVVELAVCTCSDATVGPPACSTALSNSLTLHPPSEGTFIAFDCETPAKRDEFVRLMRHNGVNLGGCGEKSESGVVQFEGEDSFQACAASATQTDVRFPFDASSLSYPRLPPPLHTHTPTRDSHPSSTDARL